MNRNTVPEMISATLSRSVAKLELDLADVRVFLLACLVPANDAWALVSVLVSRKERFLRRDYSLHSAWGSPHGKRLNREFVGRIEGSWRAIMTERKGPKVWTKTTNRYSLQRPYCSPRQ